MHRPTSILALSSAVLFVSAPARAFTEDICYPSDGGITECTPLPAACQPPGTDTPACRTAAAAAFVTANNAYPDARSTVHVDATYILAQAVGFSATDAYWIAAYSEATDRGVFEPRDESGAVVGGGSLKTATVPGLQRTDFDSGGVMIHFSAPRNVASPAPVPGVDGLHPDAGDATTEVVIAHLRAWALAGSGASRPDCTGGLTAPSAAGDNATGTTCYANAGSPATISGAISLFDGLLGQPDPGTKNFSVPTGLQILQDSDAGTVASDGFDALVGGDASRIADARLGIYLHAFADRISHHVCLDQSYLFGPTEGGAAWTSDTTSAECAQGLHSLRHMWETGIDQSQIAAEDRTTSAYISDVYVELVAFASARGALATGVSDGGAPPAIVTDLTAALETPDVTGRLAALHAVTCGLGLSPFPGEAACAAGSDGGPREDAGSGGGDAGTDAGVGSDAGTGSGSGGKSGGCSLSGADRGGLGGGALLAAAVASAWIARRRRGRRTSR
jgi:hypothetical protein